MNSENETHIMKEVLFFLLFSIPCIFELCESDHVSVFRVVVIGHAGPYSCAIVYLGDLLT